MTLAEMDRQACSVTPKPERVHVGKELWIAWVADIVRRYPKPAPEGVGFPELVSPGGVRLILDAGIPAGKLDFQSGPLL